MKTKQIIYTALIFIFSINLISAQEKITIPEVSLQQKYNQLLSDWDALAVTSINFAKTQGVSATDYGKFIGEHYKLSWDKEASFKGFATGMLYTASCYISDPAIEISTNTTKKVKFKTHLIGSHIKKNKTVYGTTYQEYIDFITAMLSSIGRYMGCTFELNYNDEWMYITITKK